MFNKHFRALLPHEYTKLETPSPGVQYCLQTRHSLVFIPHDYYINKSLDVKSSALNYCYSVSCFPGKQSRAGVSGESFVSIKEGAHAY